MASSIKSFIPKQNKYDRVVLLVDMDCFYCQVEEKLNPELKGQPLAVVQYNAWRGGGIIAVNYAARARGVTRHMRGDEAKEQCPEIQLVKVPNVREKADLTKYREAGKNVAVVLQKFTQLLERASVDEAYLDITERVNERIKDLNTGSFILQPKELVNTYAVGYENIGDYINLITSRIVSSHDNDDSDFCCYDPDDLPAFRQSDIRLLVGSSIASEIRAAVKESTGYECSAGIAHNKILAKLACGMNKPNKQTILPLREIPKLFESLPVHKIKGLGAKFGEDVCQRLKVRFLGEMVQFTEAELQRKLGDKNGSWLYNICRGIDLEAVTPKFYSKSIGCCKKFPGRNNISGVKTLLHWLNELASEIVDRLEKDVMENNRRAKQMVVSFVQDIDGEEIHSSRSAPLNNYEQNHLSQQCFDLIRTNTKQFLRPNNNSILNNPIKFLGINVGKFQTITREQNTLQQMFANQVVRDKRSSNEPALVEPPDDSIGSIHNRKSNEIHLEIMEPSDRTNSAFAEQFTRSNTLQQMFANQINRDKRSSNESTLYESPNDSIGSTHNRKSNDIHLEILEACHAANSAFAEKSIDTSGSIKSFFLNALKVQKQNLQLDSTSLSDMPTGSSVFSSKTVISENSVPFELINVASNDTYQEKGIQFKKYKDKNCNSEPESRKRKFSETIIGEGQQQPKYENQYVELCFPEMRPDLLNFTKCEICNVNLPDDERVLQEHKDMHFAQQLSQIQREEFRAVIKTKIETSKCAVSGGSTSKKFKKFNNLNSTIEIQKKSSADITKFLKPLTQVCPPKPSLVSDNVEASTSKAAKEKELAAEVEQCSRCCMNVNKSELTEHMDFHYAKELQSKMNKTYQRSLVATDSKKSKSSRTTPGPKSITKFFSQQSA